MRLRLATATATASTFVLLAAGTAQASTTSAQWDLDEPAPSTVMTDSSLAGYHLDGAIGSAVVTGVPTDTSFGYQFKAVTDGLKHNEHLVTVAHNPLLEPQAGDFAVTVRVKTTAGNQNIIQKGSANMTGGYWKLDMNHGIPICLYRDSAGVISSKTWGSTIWDGLYHSITCAKTGVYVTISVDGGTPKKNKKTIGTIDNDKVLSIGGKYYCTPPTTGCDYFVGVIDSVKIELG